MSITYDQISQLHPQFHLVRLDENKAPKWSWKQPHSGTQIQKHVEAGGLIGCLPHPGGYAVIDIDEGGQDCARAIAAALGEGCAIVKSKTKGRFHVWIRCTEQLGKQTEWAAFGGSGDLRCERGVIGIYDPTLPKKLRALASVPPIPAARIKAVVPPAKADPGPATGAISERILGAGQVWQKGGRNKALYKAVMRVRGDEEKVEILRAKAILSGLHPDECHSTIASALSKIAEQDTMTFSDSTGTTLAATLAALRWMVVGDLRGSAGFFVPVDPAGRGLAIDDLEAYDPITDKTANTFRNRIREKFFKHTDKGARPLKYNNDDWRVALSSLEATTLRDPFLVWLQSRPAWDGTPRIGTFLGDHFGAADTPLNQWGSAQLLLGAVARTCAPGCKLDVSVVLVGAQGIGKSSLLAELFPPALRAKFGWFSDALDLSQSAKCQAESMERRVLIEASEMSGRTKADLELLKAFLTRVEDGGNRAAYATNPRQVLRRCVIVGTTNDQRSLPNDPAGLRRFLPIQLERGIDVESLMAKLRDQMWAEAMATWQAHGLDGVRLPRGLHTEQAAQAEEHRDADTEWEDFVIANPPLAEGSPLAFFMQHAALAGLPTTGRVASITGQARSTLTRENGQPTDSNLAQPSSVILLRARTPICASVF